MFFVQCGREGNSSIRVVARLMSTVGYSSAWILTDVAGFATRGFLRTELLVESFAVSDRGMEGWEVEHNRTLRPVCLIESVVGYLSQEVEVCLAKLDIDAAAVCRSHCGLGLAFIFTRVISALICRSFRNYHKSREGRNSYSLILPALASASKASRTRFSTWFAMTTGKASSRV